MNTQEFLNTLIQHQDKSLIFEYDNSKRVPANYHITEVKHVKVDSVDCGAQTDQWNETVIQLWESPDEIGKTEYLSTYKALAILKKVGSMKPYDFDAEIKIEYGNAQFHTAQLFINKVIAVNNQLIIQLGVQKTDCKAKEICGVRVAQSQEMVPESCAPGSGCC